MTVCLNLTQALCLSAFREGLRRGAARLQNVVETAEQM